MADQVYNAFTKNTPEQLKEMANLLDISKKLRALGFGDSKVTEEGFLTYTRGDIAIILKTPIGEGTVDSPIQIMNLAHLRSGEYSEFLAHLSELSNLYGRPVYFDFLDWEGQSTIKMFAPLEEMNDNNINPDLSSLNNLIDSNVRLFTGTDLDTYAVSTDVLVSGQIHFFKVSETASYNTFASLDLTENKGTLEDPFILNSLDSEYQLDSPNDLRNHLIKLAELLGRVIYVRFAESMSDSNSEVFAFDPWAFESFPIFYTDKKRVVDDWQKSLKMWLDRDFSTYSMSFNNDGTANVNLLGLGPIKVYGGHGGSNSPALVISGPLQEVEEFISKYKGNVKVINHHPSVIRDRLEQKKLLSRFNQLAKAARLIYEGGDTTSHWSNTAPETALDVDIYSYVDRRTGNLLTFRFVKPVGKGTEDDPIIFDTSDLLSQSNYLEILTRLAVAAREPLYFRGLNTTNTFRISNDYQPVSSRQLSDAFFEQVAKEFEETYSVMDLGNGDIAIKDARGEVVLQFHMPDKITPTDPIVIKISNLKDFEYGFFSDIARELGREIYMKSGNRLVYFNHISGTQYPLNLHRITGKLTQVNLDISEAEMRDTLKTLGLDSQDVQITVTRGTIQLQDKLDKVIIYGGRGVPAEPFLVSDNTLFRRLNPNFDSFVVVANQPEIVGYEQFEELRQQEADAFETEIKEDAEPIIESIFSQEALEVPGLAEFLEEGSMYYIEKIRASFNPNTNRYEVAVTKGDREVRFEMKVWQVNNLLIFRYPRDYDIGYGFEQQLISYAAGAEKFILIDSFDLYTPSQANKGSKESLNPFQVEALAHLSTMVDVKDLYPPAATVSIYFELANELGNKVGGLGTFKDPFFIKPEFASEVIERLKAFSVENNLALFYTELEQDRFADELWLITTKGDVVKVGKTLVFSSKFKTIFFGKSSALGSEFYKDWHKVRDDISSNMLTEGYLITGELDPLAESSRVNMGRLIEHLIDSFNTKFHYLGKVEPHYRNGIRGFESYARLIEPVINLSPETLKAAARLVELAVSIEPKRIKFAEALKIIELIFELGLNNVEQHGNRYLNWAKQARDYILGGHLYNLNDYDSAEEKLTVLRDNCNYLVVLEDDFWLSGKPEAIEEEEVRPAVLDSRIKRQQILADKYQQVLPFPQYDDDFAFLATGWNDEVERLIRLRASSNLTIVRQAQKTGKLLGNIKAKEKELKRPLTDDEYKVMIDKFNLLPQPFKVHREKIDAVKGEIKDYAERIREFSRQYESFGDGDLAPDLNEILESPAVAENLIKRLVSITQFVEENGKVQPPQKILGMAENSYVKANYLDDPQFLIRVCESPLLRWLAVIEEPANQASLLAAVETNPKEVMLMLKYVLYIVGAKGFRTKLNGKMTRFLAEKVTNDNAEADKDNLRKLIQQLIDLGKTEFPDGRVELRAKIAAAEARLKSPDYLVKINRHFRELVKQEEVNSTLQAEEAKSVQALEAELEALAERGQLTDKDLEKVAVRIDELIRKGFVNLAIALIVLLTSIMAGQQLARVLPAEALRGTALGELIYGLDAGVSPDFFMLGQIGAMPTRIVGEELYDGLGISGYTQVFEIEDYEPNIVGSMEVTTVTEEMLGNVLALPGVSQDSYVTRDLYANDVIFPSRLGMQITAIFVINQDGGEPLTFEVGELGEVYLGDFSGELIIVQESGESLRPVAAGAEALDAARPDSIVIQPVGEDLSSSLPEGSFLQMQYQQTRSWLQSVEGQEVPIEEVEQRVALAIDALGIEFAEMEYGLDYFGSNGIVDLNLSNEELLASIFTQGNDQGIYCEIGGKASEAYFESLGLRVQEIFLDNISESEGTLMTKVGHFQLLLEGYMVIDNTPRGRGADAAEIDAAMAPTLPGEISQDVQAFMLRAGDAIKGGLPLFLALLLAPGVWYVYKVVGAKWTKPKPPSHKDGDALRKEEIEQELKLIEQDKAIIQMLRSMGTVAPAPIITPLDTRRINLDVEPTLQSLPDLERPRQMSQIESKLSRAVMYTLLLDETLVKEDVIVMFSKIADMGFETAQEEKLLTTLSKHRLVSSYVDQYDLANFADQGLIEKLRAELSDDLDREIDADLIYAAVILNKSRQLLVELEKKILVGEEAEIVEEEIKAPDKYEMGMPKYGRKTTERAGQAERNLYQSSKRVSGAGERDLIWEKFISQLKVDDSEWSIMKFLQVRLMDKPGYMEFMDASGPNSRPNLLKNLGIPMQTESQAFSQSELRDLRLNIKPGRPLYANVISQLG